MYGFARRGGRAASRAVGPADDRQAVPLFGASDLQGGRETLRHAVGRCPQAYRVRTVDDRVDGLPGVLPDRVGLYSRRPGNGRLGGAGPGLGGRVGRRLLADDHQYRPDEVRPAVRALPESRPDFASGRGRRFRRGRPRRRAALRGREVRQQARRADRHVRHDGAEGRDQGRRPRTEAAPSRRATASRNWYPKSPGPLSPRPTRKFPSW